MPNETNELPPPVNHVFVDYENVRNIDLEVIGNRTVHFTLLLGARQTKLDVTLVEKLLLHSAHVELIRLNSSGRNALDFALAYCLGGAVSADPCGYFHVVSKDKGYDALIHHLCSKHIRVHRHDDFAMLTFTPAAKPSAVISPVISPAPKSPAKPKIPVTNLEILEMRVLEHLRKPGTNRPRTHKKMVSHLTAHLGKQVTPSEVVQLVEMISQAGHLVSDDMGKITYHL